MKKYFTIHITKNWRLRIGVEHDFDFCLEMFQQPTDDWKGIYLNYCSICRTSEVRGLHFA